MQYNVYWGGPKDCLGETQWLYNKTFTGTQRLYNDMFTVGPIRTAWEKPNSCTIRRLLGVLRTALERPSGCTDLAIQAQCAHATIFFFYSEGGWCLY